jgi:glycerol-3-phosphate dehydrogenase
MSRFSALAKRYDLIVVGGGIIGAGVARDAALRGLQVALFDKSDFGSGTTSGSTRLIHGGLRYLEMLDFGLVRMDLREREILLRIASHLLKPLEFLVPFYDRSLFYRAKLRAGMLLYDALSFDKTLPSHRFLSAAEVRRREPCLAEQNLQGAASYYDAQIDSPERLCLENVIEAREHGAAALNYAQVTGAVRDGDRIAGVRVKDMLDGDEAEVRARVVINASGPWFDRVAGQFGGRSEMIRTTKGVHLACDAVNRQAVVLSSEIDGRLFFVIPFLGYSWIGTTDTDFGADPASARAEAEDVEYLLRSAEAYYPSLRSAQIYWTNAGVRALVKKEGEESLISRAHRIVDGEKRGLPGLISILGGKITGYRAIAEQATDLACRKLGVRSPCLTALTPLPGARPERGSVSAAPGIDAGVRDYLKSLYGSRAQAVLRLAESTPGLGRRLAPGYLDIRAQVIFAARQEQCATVSDYLLRRSLLGFTRDQGVDAAGQVAELLAGELGWSDARRAEEVQAYRHRAAESQAFRSQRTGPRPGVICRP